MTSAHNFLKQLLIKCKNVDSLYRIHAHLIVNGLIKYQLLTIQAIHQSLSFNLPKLALSIYHSHPKPTSQLRNLVFRCLSDHGYYSDLLSFYYQLQVSGSHRSDNFTFPFVIKACTALCKLETGKEVHCVVLRSGHGQNLVVQTSLVDMYAKSGQMGWSRKVFDEISQRDLVLWNAIIVGYASNGLDREALESFCMMQLDGNSRPNTSTFVSVVNLGGPRVKRSIHGFGLKSGIVREEALVAMYARLEDLDAARKLFDRIESKDLVSWNTMISAYSQAGKPEEAFEIFRVMHKEGARPNLVTMVSVLQSCGDLYTIHSAELAHCIAIKLGLSNLISVTTSLVSAYAKFGELYSSRSLFDEITEKNILLFNSMISAYLQNGLHDVGLSTFRRIQLSGLIPDTISVISAISGCSVMKDVNLGKSIHAYSLKRELDSNTSVMNALLALYSECDRLSDALKLFQSMKSRNVISWNTLVSGLAKVGDTNASVASFCKMQQEGIRYDLITMISILPSICRPEDLYVGMSFHALAIENGYEYDISLENTLISMYINSGDAAAAHRLFDNLSSRRTIVSWNAMMTGYRNHSLFDKVMTLYDGMKIEGHKPNSVTLLNLLPSCESKLHGESIHAFAIRNSLDSESFTSTMCMYARFEDLSTCGVLFETMDKKNIVSWNTMMSVYAQSKDNAAKAVSAFKEMLGMGLNPDPVTMLALASACSESGSLVLAQSVTCFAVRKGLDKNSAVINALIYSSARCGSSSFARDLFDRLESKDSISWSAMINAYAMHGDGYSALRLFYTMQEAGSVPDDAAYVGVLSACSHGGLVEEARDVFESMEGVHGLRPKAKHLSCMIDLLGRSGHLGEAYEIVKRGLNHGKPGVEMLESLLGACRSYGDVRVGRAIGELLLEMYPCSTGAGASHVMLSNIYAAGGRWRESGRVRWDMEMRGLKKDPGFSLVEVCFGENLINTD